MRRDLSYRLSSYLTLVLATLGLGYAEQLFFPGIAVFVLPVLLLLGAAFLAEGRWYLPIWASNLLGLAIAAGSGCWITLCLVRQGPSPFEGYLLPYLGPLLTVLLVAKLFRPKRVPDVWVLQGMGLLQVALGCVLANDQVFGAILIGYLACVLWFLASFHARREQADVPTPELPAAPAHVGQVRQDGPQPVGRWTLAVALAGGLLFLMIPRFGSTQWHPLGQLHGRPGDGVVVQMGHSDTIDLSRTGSLLVNDEVALTVTATDARGEPKRDLGPQQRWRGVVLDRYHEGRWHGVTIGRRWSEPGSPDPDKPWCRLSESDSLPDLGPGQFFVDFAIDSQVVGGLLLAEPVVYHPGLLLVPVASKPGAGWRSGQPEFHKHDWTLQFQTRFRSVSEVSYRQVLVPLEEPDLSLPVRLHPHHEEVLVAHRGGTLQEWTDQLLRDLAAQSAYRLGPDDLRYEDSGADRRLRPEQHEKIARALCAHLATSGAYTYTLDLRRHNRRLDPVEDFLRNVRQGHCERFASALALMLRTQGIASRVVKGYRGGEHRGDGVYALRHSDAHSWVEALVWRPQPDGGGERHWLTLDPTTAIEAPVLPRFSAEWWWENGQRAGQLAWREFILEYDVEQQSSLLDSGRKLTAMIDPESLVALSWRAGPWLALGLASLVAGRLLWRRKRRQWNVPLPSAVAPLFYRRMQAILAHGCALCPGPTQTPREFGETARQLLQEMPAARSSASLPVRAVALLYRVRYGNEPLSLEDEQDINHRLDQLDAALLQRACDRA